MSREYQKIYDDWLLANVLHQEEELIRRCAFINLNLTAETELALSHQYRDCIFVSCSLPKGFKRQTQDSLFFPNMGELFHLCSHLYTPEELYEGYEVGKPKSYQDCYDGKVYRHYLKMGKQSDNIKEMIARTMHDHSVNSCLRQLLSEYNERRVVGVMGGHGLLRTDAAYSQIAHLSKRLTEEGFLMVTGGGPGAMEATHLGAWMAGRNELELMDALYTLGTAPSFTDDGWLDTAMRVRSRFPQTEYKSLGIPTWLYGHEPSTPFATYIAKLFYNSVREDSILNIARGGIIYTPGSAGTLQEVFQAAVPNHYMSYGYASPMIFMGKEFWTKDVPIWPLLQDLMAREKYKNLLLSLSENENEIVATIKAFYEGG